MNATSAPSRFVVSGDAATGEKKRNLHSVSDDDDNDRQSTRSYGSDDSQLQDAVAASSALVGENVLDSPKGAYPTRPVVAARAPSSSRGSLNPYPSPPPSLTHCVGRRDDAMSVGIMAQGLAWVQRQRDRRRRQFLQNQAEQQLRRIREAREAEKAPQHPPAAPSLTDNATFQNFTKALRGNLDSVSSSKQEPTAEDETTPEDSIASTLSCQGPAVSQSGDGYSVSLLDVSESREEEEESWIPPVRVEPEPDAVVETAPFILTGKEMQQIAELVLPRGIAYCRWKRLYSLARDGDSFDQCLRFVENESRTLMVIRSSRNEVCGGFADMPWNQNGNTSASYFGGPDSCLFKVVDGKVKEFKWTGANRYILLLDPLHKMLAFGGGGDDGSFGLSVEQDFQVGSTGHCDTFQNEPLCDQETFGIVDMEIFGFLVGQF